MVCLLCILCRTGLVVNQGTLTGQHYVYEVLNLHVLPISQTVGNNFFFIKAVPDPMGESFQEYS